MRAQAEARKRVLLEFERGQLGLGVGATKSSVALSTTKDGNGDAQKADGKEENAEEGTCDYLSIAVRFLSKTTFFHSKRNKAKGLRDVILDLRS